ncbi:hypothetical protein [Paenisporosarcina antarctica]|nr:hypothetical protein [Paenisporosarcina antarctica]
MLEGMWIGVLRMILPITLVTLLCYKLFNVLQAYLEGELFSLYF